MSMEQNKAVVRRVVEDAVHAGNPAMLNELYASNYVCYDMAESPMDLETSLQYANMIMAAFPDMQVTIHHQIAEGDTVATRYTMSGTHQGAFQGIAPTGKRVNVPGTSYLRLENGKVADAWFGLDKLSLLQQIGVIPAIA